MYRNFKRVNKKNDKTSSRKRNTKTSNLTSERLTMPPGFLSQGIVSDTVVKVIDRNDCSDEKENKYILREDLHGLFNQLETSCGVQNQRRSSRIHKKNLDQNVNNAFSAADYNNILVKNPGDMNSYSDDMQRNVLKDRSKSIFKEINRKYSDVEKTNKLQYSGLAYTDDKYEILNCQKEQTLRSAFSNMLKEELSVNIREDNLKLCKAAIKQKIEVINDILVGRKNCSNPVYVEAPSEVKDSSEELENILPGFSLIPSSEWVYETPPGRKLRTSNIPKPTNMKPAVICKQENHINIYELEPNTLLDLRSPGKHFGDIQNKTFIFEDNLQSNNIFEGVSFSYHKNGPDKKFNFAKPSTQTKATIHISPPPKISKRGCNRTVIFSESEMSHYKKDVIIDNNAAHPFDDIADDMTVIEDNGNYRLATSQNVQQTFNFHCQTFDAQPSSLFNNNQIENGYTSYEDPL